jgi:hypothetical protein
MARKRAVNSGGVRAAWPNTSPDDDGEAEAQASADGCSWCTGRWAGDVRIHDQACPAAGRAERARLAERRRNGLA